MADDGIADEEAAVLGGLIGSIGAKVFKAGIPEFADSMSDHGVQLAQQHMASMGIDPLTPQQEQQLKAFLKNLVIVKATAAAEKKK